MANDAKALFQVFTKGGMTDRDAIFAVIDHYFSLCGTVDEINRKDTEKLAGRMTALEKGGA